MIGWVYIYCRSDEGTYQDNHNDDDDGDVNDHDHDEDWSWR